jgi:hypothetical protein
MLEGNKKAALPGGQLAPLTQKKGMEMPLQNTGPAWQRDMLGRWKTLALSPDPVEAAVGASLLDAWKVTRRADEHVQDQHDERPPALWAEHLCELTDPPRITRGDEYKTSHDQMHGSSSGTCLSVNTTRGVWRCSSCHAAGDVIGWVVYHEAVTRATAQLMLRRQFGAPCATT